MTELNIGAHCSYKECNQIDFLPIRCLNCNMLFCKLHSVADQHQCVNFSNTSVKEIFAVDSIITGYDCFVDKCFIRELTIIVCDRCEQQTCLKHRLPEDHCCKGFAKQAHLKQLNSLKETQGTEHPKSDLSLRILSNLAKKSSKTSTKVLQMKMKMKSVGNDSVPFSNRIYVNVSYQTQCKPMYFNKEHLMGMVLDQSAAQFNLKNENQLAFSKKLKIFSLNDKEIPLNISLEDAIENHHLELFGNFSLKYN